MTRETVNVFVGYAEAGKIDRAVMEDVVMRFRRANYNRYMGGGYCTMSDDMIVEEYAEWIPENWKISIDKIRSV